MIDPSRPPLPSRLGVAARARKRRGSRTHGRAWASLVALALLEVALGAGDAAAQDGAPSPAPGTPPPSAAPPSDVPPPSAPPPSAPPPSAPPATSPGGASAPKAPESPAKGVAAGAAKTDDAGGATKPDAAPDKSKAWQTAKAEHRGGFAIGLLVSGGVGASNGFPADSKKIGRLEYYTESGLGFTGASGLWLGGALADWLNFGAGVGFSTILNADTLSPAPLVFFHTDIYPLYWLGGQWRNLGLTGDFGLGFPSTIDSETEDVLIDGGGSSFVLGGVFWEGIKAWKMKMGPQLAAHYMFSETIRRPAAILGFRIALYTSP